MPRTHGHYLLAPFKLMSTRLAWLGARVLISLSILAQTLRGHRFAPLHPLKIIKSGGDCTFADFVRSRALICLTFLSQCLPIYFALSSFQMEPRESIPGFFTSKPESTFPSLSCSPFVIVGMHRSYRTVRSIRSDEINRRALRISSSRGTNLPKSRAPLIGPF